MSKREILITALFFTLILATLSSSFGQNIKLNQIGYYPQAQKLAAVTGGESGQFYLISSATGQTVYTGTLPSAQYWQPAGENVSLADFSDFTSEGTYYVKTNSQTSPVFDIKATAMYRDALNGAAKGFYLWRASTPIESQYATFNGTSYARAQGHADDQVEIHSSAATNARPTGTKVSAPRGWYDAGDYNLYVVNAGVSVFMLAHTYELYPEYLAQLNLNIPESNNATPDILNEIKWEMDWLLAMQDLDGGVYFKLSSKWFDSFEMPSADNLPRYMIGKSTTSALDFAAMTAMAYRLYKNSTDYPGFADKCLVASERAWQWAKSNPSVKYSNPSDISTGEYGDTYFGDEFFWAASELLISTGKQEYYNDLNFNIDFLSPQWHYVAANGIMSLALHKEELPSFANKSTITSKFTALADNLYGLYSQSAYKIPLVDFYWGSNGDIATKSAVLGSAFALLKDPKYMTASMAGLDYLLGRNATGYCFLTGFGDKFPVNIHDRRSQSDGIANSIPGYLVGGPNLDAQKDCGASSYPSSSNIAKSYVDMQCSYSTNEIAINWNAPMVALLAMTEATNSAAPEPPVPPVLTVEQSINLQQGWNIISINVHPTDSSIATLFENLDVQEIKTMDTYWRKAQAEYFNSLQTIIPGEGYLINMNEAGTLKVTGTPLIINNSPFTINNGWHLIGCPYQSATPMADVLSSKFSVAKNFQGFWILYNWQSTINSFEPGKGYFIK